jgi:hypothetical protein
MNNPKKLKNAPEELGCGSCGDGQHSPDSPARPPARIRLQSRTRMAVSCWAQRGSGRKERVGSRI